MSELSEVRKLSKKFMNNLTEGLLHPILTQVKEDQTLMLAIRKDYINIYYRGGNILEVEEHKGFYRASFDEEFNKSGQNIPNLLETIGDQADAQKWVEAFPYLKTVSYTHLT